MKNNKPKRHHYKQNEKLLKDLQAIIDETNSGFTITLQLNNEATGKAIEIGKVWSLSDGGRIKHQNKFKDQWQVLAIDVTRKTKIALIKETEFK